MSKFQSLAIKLQIDKKINTEQYQTQLFVRMLPVLQKIVQSLGCQPKLDPVLNTLEPFECLLSCSWSSTS